MAVQLADLDLRAELGVLDGHPAQGDVLAQDRRTGAAGDHADLRTANMDAVAVTGHLVPGQFESDQGSLRRSLPALQRLTPDEVVFLALQRDRESDAGLIRVGLIAELIPGEDQA